MGRNSSGVRGGKSNNPFSRRLKSVENGIRMNRYESAIVIDKKGNIVFDKRGGSRQVYFTRQEVNNMRDNVLTHNHPSSLGSRGVTSLGSTFSREDINLAISSNLKEIRAVTPHGYTYSLKRPSKGWGTSINEVNASYKAIETRVRRNLNKYLDKVGRNETTYARANRLHHHFINKELARKYGWIYSRSK